VISSVQETLFLFSKEAHKKKLKKFDQYQNPHGPSFFWLP
jgi:hypothetical protein